MTTLIKITRVLLISFILLSINLIRGQQFNSDNYLSKPHGMATIILTAGQRNNMIMATFSLFPNWEFTAADYVFNTDSNRTTDNGYSTSYYFKYMFYENEAKTGGFAFKGGTGLDPGLLIDNVGLQDAFQTYWINAPVTLPFFNNKLSLDLMPGGSYTTDYGVEGDPAFAFTYSVRLAWYPAKPTLALVGEVFGTAGEAYSKPELKAGLRWEPSQYACFALTYGKEFNGENGSGLEFGIMLFSPPFCGLGKSSKK
jgi:hypothetical protein